MAVLLLGVTLLLEVFTLLLDGLALLLDGADVLTEVDVRDGTPPGLLPPLRCAMHPEPISVNAIKKTIFLIKF